MRVEIRRCERCDFKLFALAFSSTIDRFSPCLPGYQELRHVMRAID
ncbi:hypothetical protein LL999_25990 [Burkholderia ambifaria]|nr:hypothetical protein [Burkholderia ambifaria]UEP23680.1 hypothetical protein LL999_25990 [Burkholderia ambifaria]